MIARLRRLWHRVMGQLAGKQLVADLIRLVTLVHKPRWTTPVLFILGLLAAFAETIGVTLILLFLYIALGQAGDLPSGLAGRALEWLAGLFGSSAMLAGGILAMIVARAVIAYAYGRVSSNVSEQISLRARNSVHRQYLSVDYSYLQEREQAELMETLGTETWLIAAAYSSWTRLMINGCSIAVYTAFLFVLSWKITLVALLGSGMISLIARQFSNRARLLGADVRMIHRDLGNHMLMTIQGMRTIRAYGQEEVHQRRFEESSQRSLAASVSIQRMTAWLSPMTEVGYLAILCLIIGGNAWWGTAFAVTLGAVVLLYRLQPHVRELEGNLLFLAQLEPQLGSLRAMMETHDKPYPSQGTEPFERLVRDVRFDRVSFRYPSAETLALDDVSFTIPAGKTTALVGASGSGKTTVVNLLLRLYSPSSGTILVDDRPLSGLRINRWLDGLAVAGQDVDLVEGTVIENIRMADNDAPIDAVTAAARAAGVAEFVEVLPDAYESWIGQEGLRFSGGQRQRIGLARALLRDPGFLMLDEAMSALDVALEDSVRGQIASRMAGRTMLVITHRLDLVKRVDHVVWIDQGKLKAEGPPAQIFASGLGAIAEASGLGTD